MPQEQIEEQIKEQREELIEEQITPLIPVEDFDPWVEKLGVSHHAKDTLRRLMAAGPLATPAVRRGLQHPNPVVRVGCCQVLDHFMDEGALPELIENLTHPNADVRSWAMHALACDRCKEGVCRPGEDDVIPIAARMLIEDSDRRVRQMAAGLLGPSVHRRADVLHALEYARDHDPHPVVRKIARWYTPGGPRYQRLLPKPVRPRKTVAEEMTTAGSKGHPDNNRFFTGLPVAVA